MAEPSGADQFGKRMQSVAVEIVNARRLILRYQRALSPRILGGNPGRAAAGMARQRLDAAKREHEPARRVTPIGAKRHGARDIERRNDLAAGAEADFVA